MYARKISRVVFVASLTIAFGAFAVFSALQRNSGPSAIAPIQPQLADGGAPTPPVPPIPNAFLIVAS